MGVGGYGALVWVWGVEWDRANVNEPLWPSLGLLLLYVPRFPSAGNKCDLVGQNANGHTGGPDQCSM